MKPMEALTKAQQDFAAEHHQLIYKYLHSHGLNADDYYDVAVFGYLRACKRYLAEEALQRYSFTTIAWRAMDSAVGNERRTGARQKRSAVLLSLDADMELFLGSTDADGSQLEYVWCTLGQYATEKQLQVFKIQLAGFKAREIGERCGGITPSSVYNRLYRLRKKARAQLVDIVCN